MHGYRAFRDVLDSMVRVAGGVAHMDLYQDFDWSGEGLALAARVLQTLGRHLSRLAADCRARRGGHRHRRRSVRGAEG